MLPVNSIPWQHVRIGGAAASKFMFLLGVSIVIQIREFEQFFDLPLFHQHLQVIAFMYIKHFTCSFTSIMPA
jgi:hypothetical protein